MKFKNKKETYEEIILNLIKLAEHQEEKQKELLIQGCKEIYDENSKISKQFKETLMDGLNRNETLEEYKEEI